MSFLIFIVGYDSISVKSRYMCFAALGDPMSNFTPHSLQSVASEENIGHDWSSGEEMHTI